MPFQPGLFVGALTLDHSFLFFSLKNQWKSSFSPLTHTHLVVLWKVVIFTDGFFFLHISFGGYKDLFGGICISMRWIVLFLQFISIIMYHQIKIPELFRKFPL